MPHDQSSNNREAKRRNWQVEEEAQERREVDGEIKAGCEGKSKRRLTVIPPPRDFAREFIG
jgi:hypothetical protein